MDSKTLTSLICLLIYSKVTQHYNYKCAGTKLRETGIINISMSKTYCASLLLRTTDVKRGSLQYKRIHTV